jgi:hypothetical protein
MDCFQPKEGNSIVRIFHASPNAPEVDIYIDGQLFAQGLGFTGMSDYTYLEEGIHTIEVHPAGDETTVILSKMIDVPDNRIFTIAAVGNLENLELLLIEDDIDEIPSPKESTIRIVQLSPNLSEVNVSANENMLFNNIKLKQDTDYIKVPSGNYTFNISPSDDENIALSSNLNLKANRIYTIYLIGNSPNLGIIQAVDVNSYLCR